MTDNQTLMWYAHGHEEDFGPFVSETDALAWVEETGGEWEIRPLTQTSRIMFLFWRNPPEATSPEARAFMRNLRAWNPTWFDERDIIP
jgi:hypothetical protein